MATQQKSLQSVAAAQAPANSTIETKRPRDVIASRSSRELVLAFSGPIGCGIDSVKERTTTILEGLSYKVEQIKISEYIKQCLRDKIIELSDKYSESKADNYLKLQDAGNMLRQHQTDILAEYAIQQIASIRIKCIPDEVEVKETEPQKTAYLIDQLKHPDEVQLLRMLYGNLFFLFGVLSVAPRRKARLIARSVAEAEISKLVERDRRQSNSHEQQLDKTLQLADFFIRNDHANAETLSRQIRRFCELMHGANITPTLEEYARRSGGRSAQPLSASCGLKSF